MTEEMQALARRALAGGLVVERGMVCWHARAGRGLVVMVDGSDAAFDQDGGGPMPARLRDLLPDLAHPGTAGLAVAQLERRWLGVDVEVDLGETLCGEIVVTNHRIHLVGAGWSEHDILAPTRAEAIAAAFEVRP